MIKRDYFEAIKSALSTTEIPENDNYTIDDLINFCEKEMNRLDSSAEKARARKEEKAKEADELTEQIYSVLGDDFMGRDEVFEAVLDKYGVDTTLSKVQYRLNALAKDGRVEKTETKVSDDDGKKRTRMTYRAIPLEE